jgi:hypothetical protein
MRGKGLLQRVFWVLAGACAFLVFVSLMQSEATPIRPDLEKLVQQPQGQQRQFPLARAGWNGPEQTPNSRTVNATYEELSPEASARHARAALRAAAIPDYRAVAGILLVILLLRRIRHPEKLSLAATAPTEAARKSRSDIPHDYRHAA